MSHNDDANDPLLENTFQLALIKLPTTDGVTNGFNFDLEFNYGTVTEYDDGYSAADPTSECDTLPEGNPDCRWGIGIVSYSPATEPEPEATTTEPTAADPATTEPAATEASTLEPAAASAVGYEFFAPTEVLNMMDDGATPLIANSLGTDVLGRYTCGMVNGAAVGCDPVTMTSGDEPELASTLASTGADQSLTATGIIALLVALILVAAGTVLARRSAASTTSLS